MNKDIYRFTFGQTVPMRDVEEALLLAVLAAESLHGQSGVRMDAAYCVDAEKRTCVIDAATPVGRDLCRIFTGFAIREFGEATVTVRRAADVPANGCGCARAKPAPAPAGAAKTGEAAA